MKVEPEYSPEFFLNVEALKIRDPGARRALARALRGLWETPWEPDLPVRLTSAARDEYEYQFHPRYVIVFKRQAMRDGRGSLLGYRVEVLGLQAT